jgi:hypothetical protein
MSSISQVRTDLSPKFLRMPADVLHIVDINTSIKMPFIDALFFLPNWGSVRALRRWVTSRRGA